MEGRERRYLGAVALNNSAVRLLERGRPRQALIVLQDALLAVRGVLVVADNLTASGGDGSGSGGGATKDRSEPSSPTPGSSRTIARRALGLEEALRRASQFVMESAVGDAGSRPPSSTVASITLDVDAPRFRGGGDRFAAPDAARSVIRIDATRLSDVPEGGEIAQEHDEEEDDEEADLALESMAILHNFAAAALLCPPSEHNVRRVAANITLIAFGFAHKILHGDTLFTGGGLFATVALLQLSAMVARCGYELHSDMGDESKASQSLHHFQSFQTALEEDEASVSNFLERLCSPHAKAA